MNLVKSKTTNKNERKEYYLIKQINNEMYIKIVYIETATSLVTKQHQQN
jgi:hypothetical protein